MLLPLEYKEKFIKFSKIHIEFHEKHKKFRINYSWLDELNQDVFHDQIDEFVEGLKTILISNNNNLLIVDELLVIIQDRITYYTINKIQEFSSFSNFGTLISKVNYDIEYDVLEPYTIDKVLNYNFNAEAQDDILLYCFFTHKDRTNNYNKPLDFEKVKLFFFLNQFYKSLVYFEEKINIIKNAIQVYGVTDLSHYFSDKKAPENKCNIKLDKNSSAFLFKLLIEAKLIYMDENEAKSESNIKKFAETHFNYTDSNNLCKPLTDFSKEYSKLKGSSKKNNQLKVLKILSSYISKKIDYLNK
ncbi:hypothetical protein [Flavobacterium aciduliphilum]|nr:hypothetical protein [Flavobacterium aciduliphilum]